MDASKRIFKHSYFTRENLGMDDSEESTVTEPLPLPSFQLKLVIPECDTCKRPADEYSYGLYIEGDARPVLIEAGMYGGHPANVFQNMPSADAAKIFSDLATTMLADPMKYMDLLNNEGVRSGYERTVRQLLEFSTQCKTFTTAHIAVPGAM